MHLHQVNLTKKRNGAVSVLCHPLSVIRKTDYENGNRAVHVALRDLPAFAALLCPSRNAIAPFTITALIPTGY